MSAAPFEEKNQQVEMIEVWVRTLTKTDRTLTIIAGGISLPIGRSFITNFSQTRAPHDNQMIRVPRYYAQGKGIIVA